MSIKASIAEARTELANLVNQVAFGKERIVLTRRGRDIAAIVSIEDVELLTRLEDRIDEEKLAMRRNEPSLPLAEVGKRLGLAREPELGKEKTVSPSKSKRQSSKKQKVG